MQEADESQPKYHNEIQPSTLSASDLWVETLQRTERLPQRPTENEQMNQWIAEIKNCFRNLTLELGEISVSAYDTAWVARVPALDGSPGPQFPKSLQWIIDHQLQDGDWGEPALFLGFDRVCCTLACIIALQSWGVGAKNIELGEKFLQSNIQKMEDDDNEYMPIGFEIVFPAMLDEAKALGLDLPYDARILQQIAAEREKKMKKIPMEIVHKYPTTLLHSLEGLHKEVDWNKLLKLQATNGSFLYSPASTACALMYTKDAKCLQYLDEILVKFNHAVPSVYPVDLFEHIWIVDRLERLGISRYFEREIRDCLLHVYKYWKDGGIGWASNSPVQDVDDTAMGFRLLRMHGFDVKEDCFRQFYKDGEFFCFAGQSGQAVTGMFNLGRAAQTMFPGESLLNKARTFTRQFLQSKYEKNECHDKWIITKDLAGEVEYALTFPWYASLPRLEHRTYLDQYSPDDIWIGKSLYRMPAVTNELFLKLAKADFDMCQALHKKELEQVIRWNASCQFRDLEFARQKSVECFFSAAATMFEPEMGPARLVWARCCVLTIILDDYFDDGCASLDELRTFLQAVRMWNPRMASELPDRAKLIFSGLYTTVNTIAHEAHISQNRDVSHHLRHHWDRWLTSCLTEAEWVQSGYIPTFDEYMDVANVSIALEPVVRTTLFFAGHTLDEAVLDSRDYHNVMHLVNYVGRILNDIQGVKREARQGKTSSVHIYMREHPEVVSEAEAIMHLQKSVNSTMQQLNYEVLRFTALPSACKKIHFNMARLMHAFYRDCDGLSSATAMSGFVKKVLFEPVPQ
uniref:Isoabienol synthase n=1 Tax=Pulvigera lyellii TaxID=61563 RepID=A0A8U0DC49_9BRYO|nr:isoabienol synthase [Pulvigera lyellii]